MEAFLVILAVAISSGVDDVTGTNCVISDRLVESLVARGVRRANIGHEYTSGTNSICFEGKSTNVSCCSEVMENALKEEAETLLRQQIENLMGTLQDNIRSHIEEFNQFFRYGIEFVRQETLCFLNRTGSINAGMENEMDNLFSNMLAYFTDGEISREEIARLFLDSIYAELVHQKYRRRSLKFISCMKGVIDRSDPYFFKLHQDYMESIISPHLLNARAYSQGMEQLHGVFNRLARLTITEECLEKYLRSTMCSYCKGHGDEIPTCYATCLNVFKDCTHFQEKLFFRRWQSFVDAMKVIADSMIVIPYTFTKIAPATANAIRDFNFLLIRNQYDITETCGKPRKSKLYGFIGELEDRPSDNSDFYFYARGLSKTEELGNITQTFLNPGVLVCTNSTELPCLEGTNTEQHSETPAEVLQEARTLKKLALLLKKVTIERLDPFQPEKRGRLGGGKNPDNIKEESEEEASGQEPQENCPNQWTYFQASCYFSTTSSIFNVAREECTEMGGKLVSIQSRDENDFVTSFVQNEKSWIGAAKNETGQFFWLDGSDWTSSLVVIDTEGPPSHGGCVEINNVGRGILSTLSCENHRIGVCEVPM